MKAYEDYIFGRWFYVYNDHQNLLQTAASTVPIIVRMRLYMQSHVFFRKYVKGTDNWTADFMSRMHESHKLNVINTEQSTLALVTGDSIQEALDTCHKGPQGHGGMRRTYLNLNSFGCSTFALCISKYLWTLRYIGCDLTAEGVQQYLQWSGQTHRTSLVDRHQSNGVEIINRQVMVLLHALVCDRLIQNNWSEIQNIGTVQFIINEHVCTETQTSAFNLTFGDTGKLIIGIYRNLSEVSPIISDNFIGSDKFIGWLFSV